MLEVMNAQQTCGALFEVNLKITKVLKEEIQSKWHDTFSDLNRKRKYKCCSLILPLIFKFARK